MKHRLFFFGTLRHMPLLEIVLGRVIGTDQIRQATLPGYEVRAVTEGPFPALVAVEGQQAQGLAVDGLSDSDVERLNFYEGGFAYDLRVLRLGDGSEAQVYMAAEGVCTPAALWDLEVWTAQWGDMSCHAAREVMGYFGARDSAQVAAMFPQIRARAWSRTLGERQPAGQGARKATVTLEREARVYAGYLAVDEVTLRHQRFDGTMSPALERSYLVAADAALVLPYDPVRDRVLLIEQIRVGPLGRRDPNLWLLEPIAGAVDAGETPEDAARREAQEEANLTLTALEPVARTYASPGSSTEFYHMFVGLADLPDDITGIGGLGHESEDIRSHLVSFDRFMEMADAQRLSNAPVVLLAYWLAFHRKRLRS